MLITIIRTFKPLDAVGKCNSFLSSQGTRCWRKKLCATQGLLDGETSTSLDWGYFFHLERCQMRSSLKDLFYYHVKRANLNANADDPQIYVSNVDLVTQIGFAGCRLKNQRPSPS